MEPPRIDPGSSMEREKSSIEREKRLERLADEYEALATSRLDDAQRILHDMYNLHRLHRHHAPAHHRSLHLKTHLAHAHLLNLYELELQLRQAARHASASGAEPQHAATLRLAADAKPWLCDAAAIRLGVDELRRMERTPPVSDVE